MRQIGFAQAYEVIAHDPARVLQSFFRPNRYLGGQPLSATVHRRADDRGNLESRSAWRLTITNVRYRFRSPPGL